MSKGTHRGPVHRGLRDLLYGLWLVVAVRRRVTGRAVRSVSGARPAEISTLATLFPATMTLAQSYNLRCPDCGRSPVGCARWRCGYY